MISIFTFNRHKTRSVVRLCLLAGLAMIIALSLDHRVPMAADNAPNPTQQRGQMIIVPDVDAMRGRRLFVVKGCVTCHRVKTVGGKAAPALDAPVGSTSVNPLDFAARMWRGATAMQELQSLELGYQIELTGNEIGDLAAFVSDPAAQKSFSLDEVPELLRDWFIDEAYWRDGEWPETDEWRFPPGDKE
jgi:hypothetical protein